MKSFYLLALIAIHASCGKLVTNNDSQLENLFSKVADDPRYIKIVRSPIQPERVHFEMCIDEESPCLPIAKEYEFDLSLLPGQLDILLRSVGMNQKEFRENLSQASTGIVGATVLFLSFLRPVLMTLFPSSGPFLFFVRLTAFQYSFNLKHLFYLPKASISHRYVNQIEKDFNTILVQVKNPDRDYPVNLSQVVESINLVAEYIK